jgi:hypothetical protein
MRSLSKYQIHLKTTNLFNWDFTSNKGEKPKKDKRSQVEGH